ncbi:aspartate aminotransferase family protein [Aspergillus puulaauensis]|uniref:Pyridoxal phosphate-dependent transferase n=1 Tax=Aspergillus puulaauensis TaxID=1220207 RepID=A0A7R8AI60_9EURO|nr:uncharacterized protein APUU_20168A [Aspergillus puulaauensis]BCS19736.1 hypothetical protein APUU_20168A [Aspergillus puulaauensis]
MNLIARLFLPRSVRMEKSPTMFIADSPTSFCLVLSTCRNLESIMSSRAQQASAYLQDSRQRYGSRNPKSKVQHERAARHLPGGNTRSVLHGSPFPLCMASGRANRLVDIDGHEYLDFMCDMTAGLYGHSHPLISETITSTLASTGMNVGATTVAEARFAEAISDRFTNIDQLRFCNSGTEANLYALSVARQVTGRRKVIVFEGAYHGGVLSFAHGVAPNNVDREDWILGQYNDRESVVHLIAENKHVAAAVLVEPMQGAGGCIPGTAEFLHAIQETAKENGILFILDEVMTSRLAPGGLQSAILHPVRSIPLMPDLTTLGKWIGGGLSIGVFGGRQDLMSVYDPRTSNIQHSGTFNNNTLAMNVGYKAMTSIYTDEACAALNALGDDFRVHLQKLATGTKLTVTGVGSVMTVHFLPNGGRKDISRIHDIEVDPQGTEAALRDLFWLYLVERGLWIARRGMISFILGTTKEQVDQLLGAVKEFLEDFQDVLAAE